MTEIFKKHKEEELINIYIDIVKKHYVAIKKNQNEM